MGSSVLPAIWTIDTELRNQLKPTAIGDAFMIHIESVGEIVECLESVICGSIHFYCCDDWIHRITCDCELLQDNYIHNQDLADDYVHNEFYISPGILSMYCTPESNTDPRGEMIPDNLYQRLGFIHADPISNILFVLDDVNFRVDRIVTPTVTAYDVSAYELGSFKKPCLNAALTYNKSIVVCTQYKPKADQLHFSDTYRMTYMLACELITMMKEGVVKYEI